MRSSSFSAAASRAQSHSATANFKKSVASTTRLTNTYFVDEVLELPERKPRAGEHVAGCTFFLWGNTECAIGAQAEDGAAFEQYKLGTKRPQVTNRKGFIALRPFLLIETNSSAEASRLASLLDAFDTADARYDTVRLPIHERISRYAKFDINDDTLSIEARGNRVFTIRIKDRLSYFLKLTQCLHFYIYDEPARPPLYFGAINGRHAPIQWPIEAVHRGSINPGILEKSKEWRPAIILDYNTRDGDTGTRPYACQSESYYISQERAYTPEVRPRACCIVCQGTDLNDEHCIPDWLSKSLNVIPITAKVFCKACNSFFGDELESPVATLYRSGLLMSPSYESLVDRWAAKTAIALASISHVHIPQPLIDYVRSSKADPLLLCYRERDDSPEEATDFWYRLTNFDRAMPDAFLFCFGFGPFVFILIRGGQHRQQLGQETTPTPTHASSDVPDNVYDGLLQKYFGITLEIEPADLRRTRPRNG